MHRIIYTAVLSAIMLATGCSIATSVHFNRNYSGNYEMAIDMGELLSMAMMMDSSMTSEEEALGEIREGLEDADLSSKLDALEGISNSSAGLSDEGQIVWSFDFKNVDALNAALLELNESMMDGNILDIEGMDIGGQEDEEDSRPSSTSTFTRDGKVIRFRTDMDRGDSPVEDMEESDMSMVSNMIDYTVNFSFDRNIKDVEMTGLDIISQDKKTIKARMDLIAAMKAKYYEISIRLK